MTEACVAVDARHLKSGIGTYLENLVPALVASTPWRWRLIGPERWSELVEGDRVTWVANTTPIYTLREHGEIARAATGADLLWVPQYNAPWGWRGKLVVTLHDLIHRMPEYTPPSLKTWVSGRLMARSLARADRVITVSEYSKMRLAEFFPGREQKCTVIPNGVQPVPDSNQPSPVPTPYVLSFGNALPHKNFARLIDGFCGLPESRPEKLVLAGPRGRAWPELKTRADAAQGRVILLDNQEREGWANLIRHAALYVCPSLEEGFGLPPLEALSAGLPVACARSASLPEVLDDAAVWFDPRDPADITRALQVGLDDDTIRDAVVTRGAARVVAHAWSHSVEAHARVLREVLR